MLVQRMADIVSYENQHCGTSSCRGSQAKDCWVPESADDSEETGVGHECRRACYSKGRPWRAGGLSFSCPLDLVSGVHAGTGFPPDERRQWPGVPWFSPGVGVHACTGSSQKNVPYDQGNPEERRKGSVATCRLAWSSFSWLPGHLWRIVWPAWGSRGVLGAWFRGYDVRVCCQCPGRFGATGDW